MGYGLARFQWEWTCACGDGTRGKRALKRMGTELVGHEYHPDVGRWVEAKLSVPRTKAELVEMTMIVRRLSLLSAEL